MKLVDIHTHTLNESHIAIFNLDIEDADKLSIMNFPISVGIHPWSIKGAIEQKLSDRFFEIVSNKKIAAIGECGLDRAIAVNFNLQMEYFHMQNEISNQVQKPVIIHCVRAYSDFLQMLKSGEMKTTWIFHGFRGNYQTASKLIDFGAYISIGNAILRSETTLVEVVKKIPLQRLFIETDNSSENLETIYEKVSILKGIKMEEFKNQIYQNFAFLFNYGFR